MNWDYSPAREATALIYPLFEYSLLIYIVLSYLQIRNDYDGAKVGTNLLHSARLLFWVKIIFVAWFRMIFVCTVTQDPIPFFGTEISPVLGHTLGFIGMQIALILIAFENIAYAFYTQQSVFRMSPSLTRKVAMLYLTSLFMITCFKLSWAFSFFATGTPWFGSPWPHIIDRIWLVMAAILPLFFAINGMRTEPDMIVSISQRSKANRSNVVHHEQEEDDNQDIKDAFDDNGL